MSTFDLFTVLLPALLAIFAGVGIVRWQMGRRQPEATDLEKAVANLKLYAVASGCILLVLWFMLPDTATLSSFGLPRSVEDIESAEKLLGYLQDYNKALVRSTQVLYYFIFTFVWWFLTAIWSLSKALTGISEHPAGLV